MLRFAPAAAAGATSLGAHREAAAQYARALRFGDRVAPAERAALFEARSGVCYVTDQYDDGIAALEDALEIRRALGDGLKEGDDLRRLSEFLWCPGRTVESERCAPAAVTLLEALPPGRELAWAHANLAFTGLAAARVEEALAGPTRARRRGASRRYGDLPSTRPRLPPRAVVTRSSSNLPESATGIAARGAS